MEDEDFSGPFALLAAAAAGLASLVFLAGLASLDFSESESESDDDEELDSECEGVTFSPAAFLRARSSACRVRNGEPWPFLPPLPQQQSQRPSENLRRAVRLTHNISNWSFGWHDRGLRRVGLRR